MFAEIPQIRGNIQQRQLVNQQFPKGLSTAQGDVFVLHIRPMVADAQLVIGGFVIEVLLEVKLFHRLRLVVAVLEFIHLLSLLKAFLKRWVGLELLLDPRLQLQGWHLQQLHQLNLLRR